jgi:CRISPR-associated endoribonuclease Cas6
MRFRIQFKLDKPELPLDYRKLFISFLKKCFMDYNEEIYEQYYKANVEKPFGFSVNFSKPKFKKDIIRLDSDLIYMFFTTGNQMLGINAYNSFIKQKKKEFKIPGSNAMTPISIVLINEKNIVNNRIAVNFDSPLVVRMHEKGKPDNYFSYDSDGFNDEIAKVLRRQVKNSGVLNEKLVDTFKLTGIKPSKTIVKFYDQDILCSIGTYEMQGHPELLDYFYKNCIASRKSGGFGMFSVI